MNTKTTALLDKADAKIEQTVNATEDWLFDALFGMVVVMIDSAMSTPKDPNKK